MNFMTWNKSFELGVPEMDKQHKKWLDLLNDFYSHMDDGMQERISILLDGVLDYTHYHFTEEEKFMESINYPEVDKQKSMHKDIIAKIEEYKAKAEKGKLVVSLTLTSELKKWFKEHILVEDMKYADFIKKSNL